MFQDPGQNFVISYRRKLIARVVFGVGIFFCIVFFLIQFNQKSSKEPAQIWLIDNSLSMASKDIGSQDGQISRLDLAKRIISSHQLSGNQGLITFARVPYLQVPLTSDTELFGNAVKNIEIVAGAGGSDIVTAVKQVARMYDTKNIHITVISDGEGFDTPDIPDIFGREVQWTVIGVGTTAGAHIITGYKSDGTPYYKEYQGEQVVSKFDASFLKKLTKALDGQYFHIKHTNDLTHIVDSLGSIRGKSAISSAHGLIFLACICIIASYYLLPYVYRSDV